MPKCRADEIQQQIATLMAEADALNQKADSEEGLSPDEQARLDEILAQVEQLQAELATAESQERFQAVKARFQAPTRPAPKVAAYPKESAPTDMSEGLRLWFMSQFPEARLKGDDFYRMAQYGFHPGSASVSLPFKWDHVNHKKRAKYNTGGSGVGAELIYKTYASKVVEFISYESLFVGLLASETLDNGNERTFFRVDPTGLKSSKTSASSDSETNPTIPEVNASTSKVVLKPITYTSGYQRITFEMVQDSGVNLWDRMAGWNGQSHARALEEEVLIGTGNGSNGGVQGIVSVANALTTVAVADFNAEVVEGMYYRIPAQYRSNAVFVTNDATAALLRQKLKDGNDRSLFDKNIVDGVEWDVFMGKKFYVSNYVPADTILYFLPDHYQVLFGGGEEFAVFQERFWPDRAVAGLIRFSGAWLGPTGANGTAHKLVIDTEE